MSRAKALPIWRCGALTALRRAVATTCAAALVAGSLAAASALAQAAPAGASPATVYAAPTTQGTGSCADAADACTLDVALAGVSSGGTIDLAGGTYTNADYTDSVSVTFAPESGAHPVLQGNGTSGGTVLTVGAGVTASMSGVRISGGYGVQGIHNAGTLTLTGCSVTNDQNTASGATGGGIYNASTGVLELVTSSVSSDGAGSFNSTGQGGGIYDAGGVVTIRQSQLGFDGATLGGAVYLTGGDLTVRDSNFSSDGFSPANMISAQEGGAIYDNGSIDVEGSNFSGDTAGSGGAIYASSPLGSAALVDSTFGFDSGGSGGSAIDAVSTPVTVVGTTFFGDASSPGGALGSSGATMTIAASILATGQNSQAQGPECAGTIQDAGYNVDDDGTCGFSTAAGSVSDSPAIDSYLGNLGAYGGPTSTVPLLVPTSPTQAANPALAAVPGGFGITLPDGSTYRQCVNPDQRGVERPSPCDMGSYETTEGTSLTLTTSAAGLAPGQQVTYTATVLPVPSGGTVTFDDGAGNPATASCAAVPVSAGVATCTVSYPSAGAFQVSSAYSGSAGFLPSTSVAPLVEQVGTAQTRTATSVSLTPSASEATVGEPVTYTATVTPAPDGGTVSFDDGTGNPATLSCGNLELAPPSALRSPARIGGVTPVATATCTVTYAAPGLYAVTASYSGDSGYAPSISPTSAVLVRHAPTSTALAASNTAPPPGSPVTLRAEVRPAPAAGTVTFSDDGKALPGCTAVAVAGGGAACTVTFPPGAHAVAAAYSGDTTLAPSVSPPLAILVAVPTIGYWLADAAGDVFAYGDAAFLGSPARHVPAPVCGMAAAPGGAGYWLTDASGDVFTFGRATSHGSLAGRALTAPVVGIAPAPDGRGYWLVAADGGVFAFGSARYLGSMGGHHLNTAVVGIAATPDGRGYWLVARDGGVFAFGSARYLGSMGAVALAGPIVGMARTATGRGYWLVGSDGGVFAFGDARFHGSLGRAVLTAPVVGMAADPATGGYWLVTGHGSVFPFAAPFEGSLGDLAPVSREVAIVAA